MARAPAREGPIVVGGGPAGLTAAVALAQAGVPTTLVARRPVGDDNRTSALFAGSVAALEALGVWRLCRSAAAPLMVLRLIDDTGRLLRAPEIAFTAAEIGLEAFGCNIENRHLLAALEARARELPILHWIDDEATAAVPGDDRVSVSLKRGTMLAAPLVIAADGRRSRLRAAAGIAVDARHYPQTALTLCFAHEKPHRNSSTEFHTPSGPFTLVPLPGNRSSLVWVLPPAQAEEVTALDDARLSQAIEQRSHSLLGKVAVEPERRLFPLEVATARRLAARRIALVGESAHVVPPIGAQGLNLGLRDAATIAECVAAAHRSGRDIGGINVLARYDRMRRKDVDSRTFAVDLFNRTLLTSFLPVQAAWALGLYLIDRIGPLRRSLMREGLAPTNARPRLMRGEAL